MVVIVVYVRYTELVDWQQSLRSSQGWQEAKVIVALLLSDGYISPSPERAFATDNVASGQGTELSDDLKSKENLKERLDGPSQQGNTE